MSTIYAINAETSVTGAAGDFVPVYQTNTGRTKKVSLENIRVYTLGTVSGEKLGFYGATSVTQPTTSNQAAAISTAAVSVSATQWAYATSTQADGIQQLANAMRSALVTLGLAKGS